MNRVTVILAAALIAIFTGLVWIAFHYHSQSVEKDAVITTVTGERDNALADIRVMETQRQTVAAIDIKQAKELADAKAENERLRADIANGTKRLQLNATCPKPVPKTTSTSGIPDAESPRLTADAELNYWRLRGGIATLTSQVNGLQDYVTNVCLAPSK
ncbi:lysis protein [Yersinia proxima]|uniref:lysis protein n=1 Tax=Yersinia proxima TaxID=2890316 RepID=UPI001D117C17|nr:lysis protein [Yersinia proxima]